METPSPVEPALPAEWESVIAAIEQALAEADAHAQARVQDLEAAPPLPTPLAEQDEWRRRLEQWEALRMGLQTFTSRADDFVRETCAALHAGEEAIARWRQTRVAPQR